MLDITTAAFWIAVAQIILIDILLGGDNAVVIALACRKLPDSQRKKGIFWGCSGSASSCCYPRMMGMVTSPLQPRWPE
jgi:predicted tellurium resistance membrane protein TerC